MRGPVWSDPGSGGGEDTIHLYGFAWSRGAPDQETFEALMREAVLGSTPGSPNGCERPPRYRVMAMQIAIALSS
jgi:hypothetical protein